MIGPVHRSYDLRLSWHLMSAVGNTCLSIQSLWSSRVAAFRCHYFVAQSPMKLSSPWICGNHRSSRIGGNYHRSTAVTCRLLISMSVARSSGSYITVLTLYDCRIVPLKYMLQFACIKQFTMEPTWYPWHSILLTVRPETRNRGTFKRSQD